MFNFIPEIWRAVRDAVAPLLSTDNFKKLFGLFTSWYTYVIGAGLYVTYKLFDALKEAGFIAWFERTLLTGVETIKVIANTCFTKIGHLQSMLDCIKNS